MSRSTSSLTSIPPSPVCRQNYRVLSLPARLGRLRRIERIGAGGFASVWRYHDDELESDVAVKALADNWSQRLDIRERFLEEARILRRADDNHVVRVYDIGETDSGTPYFVMSYADRGTVADLVADGPATAGRRGARPGPAGGGEGSRCCTATGSSTATSSRRTCCCAPRTTAPSCSWPISGWRRRPRTRPGSLRWSARRRTWRLSRPGARASTSGPTCTRSALWPTSLLTGRLVRDEGLNGLLDPRLPPAPSTVADVPAALDPVILRALAPRADDRWPGVDAFLAGLDRAHGGDPTAVTELHDAPTAPRRQRALVTALLAAVVLAAAFAVSYVVTGQVR